MSIGGLLVVAVLALFASYLLWKMPKAQTAAVTDLKDRIDLENKARQTLAQVLGGLFVLLGLAFSWQTVRSSLAALELNRQGQITDRFSKAVTQIGDKQSIQIRIGGIFALGRIAKDSEADDWSVVEVLTAFIREEAPWPPKGLRTRQSPAGAAKGGAQAHKMAPSAGADTPDAKPASDIQAALKVLGERSRVNTRPGVRMDLSRTDLRRADLREANLERAYLRAAHLEHASLWSANLKLADLSEADLTGTDLRRAHLERADLSEALGLVVEQLEGACVDGETRLPPGMPRPPPCRPEQ